MVEHRMNQPEPELYETRSNEDSMQLPPRSKARQEKKRKKKEEKKKKYKLKYPLISALSIFFISLPAIAYFSYKHYAANQAAFLTLKAKETEEVTGYEVVDFADPSDTATVPEETEKNVEKEQKQPEDVQEKTNPESTPPSNGSDPVSTEGREKEKTKSSEKDKAGEYQIIEHTVQSNDTLFSIAIQYYHDVSGTKLIREWNKLDNGKIKQGQVLKIPIKTEKLPN